MSDEPLNCPLCGSEVVSKRHTNRFTEWWLISCPNCHISQTGSEYEFEFEAIAAWNQRKPMERIVEELKNLKKCYNGEEDAVMKSMGFDEYIQEIINLAEEGVNYEQNA